ncbi:MAG: diaminopimelate epimerase, partial [Planctomycetota bacterium]
MRFTKMHGAGNDYVYVDLFEETVRDAAALARAMSDRHKGVGSDGLILLGPSRAADVRMEMYNADGSRAEMCGNGVRCLAKLAYECGRSKSNPMRVETDSGLKAVELRLEGGTVVAARVDMGVAALDPEKIPVRLAGPRVVDRETPIFDRTFPMTCVSMGNPHAVLFVDDVGALDVARYGGALERSDLFPRRT